MGQLFDRLTNFAKSYINSDTRYSDYNVTLSDEEDAELKRIIDELNSPKSKTANENKTNTRQSSQQRTNSTGKAHPLQKEYDTLGLDPNVTNEILKQKYKQLVKENHPDAVGNNSQAVQDKMTNINSAYSKIKKARGL